MKILVTGAAGRLGRQLCRELLQHGHEVRGVDITVHPKCPVRLEVFSILNREACYRFSQDCEAIIHLANHPNEFVGDPQRVYGENMLMNINMFQAAHECGVPKLIFASSIQAVSGRRKLAADQPSQLAYLPLDGHSPANPANPYALSKVHAESMLQYYARVHGRTCVAIRYPGLISNPSRFKLYNDGKTIHEWSKAHTTGDEAFTFLLTREAARFTRLVAEKNLSGYHCFLPAMREPTLYARNVEELARTFYPNVPWKRSSPTFVDLDLLREMFGWEPSPLNLDETSDEAW